MQSSSATVGTLPLRRPIAAAVTALAMLATAGVVTSTHRSAYADTLESVSVMASDDTYVAMASPQMAVGSWKKLVASDMPGNHKVIYLKFHVEELPADATGVHAVLRLTRNLHHLPTTTLTASTVSGTGWAERWLTAATAPSRGHAVGSVRVTRSVTTASIDLGATVSGNGIYSFAVSSSSTVDVASFRSWEAGSQGPRLAITYGSRGHGKPSPTPTTTSPAPAPTTTSPAPEPTTTSPAPAPTTTSPAPAPTTTSPAPAPTTTSPAPSPTTTSPAPAPTSTTSSSCGMSAKLVPTCGVLLGGWVTSYGGSSLMDKVHAFENGTGTRLAVVHDYRQPGQTLSSYDVTAAQRADTYLQLNWKPSWKWADATGGNATVNGQIDAMARSIKNVGSKKIFLSVFHEPENDVTSGASGCTIYKGSAGTPADYRAMWRNVHNRFAALGVTNVVWVMNYMGWQGWNCMVDDLWPGNDLVDWIIWDPYGDDRLTFSTSVSPFYNFLSSNADSTHAYTSKPWGIGEFGTVASTLSGQHAYYDNVRSAVDNNTFPRLKMLSVFDSMGTNGDDRVRYDINGTLDPNEVNKWDALAHDAKVNHLH